jgi:hypothetical protein
MELTFSEFYVYVLIAQVVIAALIGLIPLIVGRRRSQNKLGTYGYLATLVAGVLSPLAALIVAVIFVWVIVRKANPRSEPAGDDPQQDQA